MFLFGKTAQAMAACAAADNAHAARQGFKTPQRRQGP